MEDKELIRLLKKGDQEAFKTLYLKYIPKLKGFLNYYFGQSISTEDFIQETFIRIWEKRHNIDEAQSFNNYLFQAAKRLVYNNLRRRVKESRFLLENKILSSHTISNPTEETFNLNELSLQLQQVVKTLPPSQQEIFMLSRDKGLKNEEIAKLLNISVRTVENQIYKALKNLKQHGISPESLLAAIILGCNIFKN